MATIGLCFGGGGGALGATRSVTGAELDELKELSPEKEAERR
jgi:hypothetical protein